MTTCAAPAGGGSELMNEMIAAMATKKGAIFLQYVCQFDFSPWIKLDDPAQAILTDRLKCYALRSMRYFPTV